MKEQPIRLGCFALGNARGEAPRIGCVVCLSADVLGNRRFVRWFGVDLRHHRFVIRSHDDVPLVEATPLDLAAAEAFGTRGPPEEEKAPLPRPAAKATGVEDGCLFCHDDSSKVLRI